MVSRVDLRDTMTGREAPPGDANNGDDDGDDCDNAAFSLDTCRPEPTADAHKNTLVGGQQPALGLESESE